MLWYYIKVKKVTFGNLLAVLDVDKDARSGIPTQVLLSGVEGLEYSNNLGEDATTAERHVIPHGIHVKGKLINLMGLGNANVDVTVAKTHLEGMFSLDCMKLGSVIEVVGDSSQLGKTSDASCQGAGVKGYFAILSEAKGGKKSTGNWCKSDACLEGDAHVSIPFLGIKASFLVKILKHKGALSAKGLPFVMLPGSTLDIDVEWGLKTNADAQKEAPGLKAGAKLELTINVQKTQELLAKGVYTLIRVIYNLVKAPIDAAQLVIQKVKTFLDDLKRPIEAFFNKLKGKLETAKKDVEKKIKEIKDKGCQGYISGGYTGVEYYVTDRGKNCDSAKHVIRSEGECREALKSNLDENLGRIRSNRKYYNGEHRNTIPGGCLGWGTNNNGYNHKFDGAAGGTRGDIYAVCGRFKGPLPPSQYIGCFKDYTNGVRDMPHQTANTESGEGCADQCRAKGFKYMGQQHTNQCFCSNTYRSQGTSTACGAGGKLCGGGKTTGQTFTYEKYKDGHECAGDETSKGYITFAQCQAACTAEANCKFIDFAKPGKGGRCKGKNCKCYTVSHECKTFDTNDEYTVFKKVKKDGKPTCGNANAVYEVNPKAGSSGLLEMEASAGCGLLGFGLCGKVKDAVIDVVDVAAGAVGDVVDHVKFGALTLACNVLASPFKLALTLLGGVEDALNPLKKIVDALIKMTKSVFTSIENIINTIKRKVDSFDPGGLITAAGRPFKVNPPKAVTVGSSGSHNRKSVSCQKCSGCKDIKDHSYKDTWRFEYSDTEVTAIRTDSSSPWGHNLKVVCITSNFNSQKVVMNGESGNHNQYGKARRVSAGYNRVWHGPMCLRYTTDGSVGKQGFMVSLKSGGRPAKVEAESTKVQRVQVDTKDTPQTTSKSGSAAAFVGLLATPRMWSTVRTTKQINDMKKELVQGHEDGLIGAWGFDTEQPEIM